MVVRMPWGRAALLCRDLDLRDIKHNIVSLIPFDRPSYRYKADWICCVRQACVIASCVHAMVKLSPQNCNLSASIAQKIVKVVSRGPSERDGNVIGIGA
jgi:hypothetical protein